MPRPDPDLTAALAPLVAVPVDRQTLPDLLATLADRAAPVLGAVPVASLTLLRGRAGRTVATSDDEAVALDEVQYRADDGPCLAAARSGRPAHALAADGSRWPEVTRALRDTGYAAVWSHPVPLTAPAAGSLNVYVRSGGAAVPRDLAAALVEAATVPVTNVWLYEEAVRTAENLRAAMESRAVIEQAKGILMARLRVTADQAFAALTRTSNSTNTKLRDVASRIVETGEIPR